METKIRRPKGVKNENKESRSDCCDRSRNIFILRKNGKHCREVWRREK